MQRYASLHMPQTVHYGRNAFETVGRETAMRGSKALIISDKIMDSLGYVAECQSSLNSQGIESATYLGVVSEPTDTYVDEALALLKEKNCDVIISLGGGSCIDTAKAISVLATNGGYIGDYMGRKKEAEQQPVPHIAIPTTAGTGSEATDVTIITNISNDVKMMIKQPAFMPCSAIVDPLLTLSSPQKVTAATGVDALSHAIEAYLSRKSHPMTDMLALSAMKLIVDHIRTAYKDGGNVDAREAMSLGALQAGMAFSNASVCLVHGMSRPIGALFHVPHGFSNAMLLPAILDFSKSFAVPRLADLGRIFSEEMGEASDEAAADFAVDAVKELCLDLEIPNLQEWGIEQEMFEASLIKMAEDALESGSPGNNPRVPSKEEIVDLYRVCYNYEFSSGNIVR